MLIVKPTQLEGFEKPVTERKRQIQLEKWRDQGFEVKDNPEKHHITLIDKEQGKVDLFATNNGVELKSDEQCSVKIKSNQQGQLQSITDPADFKVQFKYNEEQRLSKLKRGDHSDYQFEYDEFSHLHSIQYPDQSQLEFLHSPKGQLISSTNRNGDTTQYRYSKTGQLKQQTDPKGNLTRFEHHNTDAPSALVFPNGDRHQFSYDVEDNLKGIKINGKQYAEFTRDTDKGTVAIQYETGGDVQFTVSGKNLVKASNETGTLTLEYDDQGRLLKETFEQQSIEYKRNKLGALVALILPDKTEFIYTRDNEQRVIGVTDWKESLHRITYSNKGSLQQINHPNGTKVTHDTNQLGLVEALEIQSPFYPQRTIDRHQYSYDVCDRVISASNSEHQNQFAYDKEGRLISVESSQEKYNEFFHLDANGNCVQNQYGSCSVNADDQLQSFATHELHYDHQGNTKECPTSKGQAKLQYNGRNQLISATTPQGTTHYAYDPLGRRIRKQGSAKTTYYQWAGQQLISEKTIALDGSLLSTCDYLYFPDSFHLMAIRQDNKIYYSHLGRRGEVLAMTDTKGEVVWKADYNAFGVAHISIEKIEQSFRLAGHYYDNETGLHYVLARYYSPHLGRFLSRDPLFTEGGSQNFYLYCDGDPLNRIDPTGEFIFTAIIIGAVIGAAIGAGLEAYRQSKAIERGEQQGYDGWGIAKAGAIGGAIGAVGGGVGAAVEGAFAVGAAATIAGGAGIGAVSGVATSLAEQCAEAYLKDKPLDPLTVAKEALIDGVVGAVIGAVTAGTGGFLARRARKGVQEGVGVVVEQAAKEAAEQAAKEAAEKAAKEASKKISLLNPDEIRFSQTTVSYKKIDRKTGKKFTYDDLVDNMKKDGWKGDPVDVVKMPDGKVTSIDNTRILAAREAGIDVQATVRQAGDKLSPAEARRFTDRKKGFEPETWGEAISGRVSKQKPKSFPKENPSGSITPPRVTGKPK